jgi:hypothetical protein
MSCTYLTKYLNHGRMARGGHGIPKVSPGPAMPDPSTPCGQTFRGGSPAGRVACGRLLPFGTPYAYDLN